jgi:peptide/nickel transport system substrate-binding protein
MLSDPYFTTEYVHLGPFRLADWGLGENVVFERYDGYFLGKPKVGKMVIRVIGDPNAMLAALRAGAVDVIPAKTLSADLYSELADEWKRTDEGVVARAPDNWRYIWFQFDPRWAQPVEIGQDVRFRRGFLFALDRDAIRELIHPGIPEAATNSFLAGNDPRDSIVGQPFARYPYDPNRALQEWADAGWRRGADGRLLNPAGQPVQVEIRATDQDPRQIAAMAAGWRQLGVDMTEFITPPAMARDSEFRAKFPAMESRGRGTGEDIFVSFDSREASGPENRWSGASNGHYANPALDRLRDQMLSTVDFERRANLLKEAGEILATDLPAIPIYYGMMFMSIRSPVKGPLVEDFSNMHESAGSAAARNAHLWERT